MWFFLNLYLQHVLGLGAFVGGAALLPMTVAIMIMMVVAAPRLINRFGPKPLVVSGLFVLAGGMLWLSFVRPDGSFAVDVLPASLVAAAGRALAFIPSLSTAISSARPEEGGLASGIVNISYQVGSALGLAAMTALAASPGAEQLGDGQALTEGFSAAFLGAAGVALAGSVVAALALRQPPGPPGSPRRLCLARFDHKEDRMPDVTINVTENGPLSVKGPFRLIDADGNEYDVGERKRVALCRCGGSMTKPFCDGTHSRTGFEAAERAVAASEGRPP